ncbi:MAG: hypothetical protein LBF86_09725 [Helicobacteraceae bacterium]|jgi:hypothetical protein|nr:hypothetical protein [Helicobacteraceae bacterium]
MTLLRARKIVLQNVAEHLNERYSSLYYKIHSGRLTLDEARLIGAEIESLEDMIGYVKSEARSVNRDSVREAADEVLAIWQKEAR